MKLFSHSTMMLKEVFFSSLFSLLSLSGANLHPTPKFILLSYAEDLHCLGSCACPSWKRRNWRARSGLREVGDGIFSILLRGQEFPRDGVRTGRELVWSSLGHVPPPNLPTVGEALSSRASGVDQRGQDLRKTSEA